MRSTALLLGNSWCIMENKEKIFQFLQIDPRKFHVLCRMFQAQTSISNSSGLPPRVLNQLGTTCNNNKRASAEIQLKDESGFKTCFK